MRQRGPQRFDRTYEGLKRSPSGFPSWLSRRFNRTYEGLKLSGPRMRWASTRVLTVPMRV